MVGHGGSSEGLYLADPTSPILSHCASIVATSTVRVKLITENMQMSTNMYIGQLLNDSWLVLIDFIIRIQRLTSYDPVRSDPGYDVKNRLFGN